MSDTQTLSEIKTDLLAVADASHAQYPQYRGHWDGWLVARATANGCKNKWGQGAQPGEYLLFDPASVGRGFVTVFLSAAHGDGCDTVVYCSEIEVLG